MITVYLPPATGFTLAMQTEIETLRATGLGTLAFAYPPDRGAPRGLESARGEAAYWDAVCFALADMIAAAGTVPAKCVLVGFNFGGSLAACFATRHPVRGLVAAGSIPRLSEFWVKSDHRVAVATRGRTAAIDGTFGSVLRPLDLTTSIPSLALPVLLQFGRSDDWIDAAQVAELESAQPPSSAVKWYDDDHAMTGSAAQGDRMRFLKR